MFVGGPLEPNIPCLLQDNFHYQYHKQKQASIIWMINCVKIIATHMDLWFSSFLNLWSLAFTNARTSLRSLRKRRSDLRRPREWWRTTSRVPPKHLLPSSRMMGPSFSKGMIWKPWEFQRRLGHQRRKTTGDAMDTRWSLPPPKQFLCQTSTTFFLQEYSTCGINSISRFECVFPSWARWQTIQTHMHIYGSIDVDGHLCV